MREGFEIKEGILMENGSLKNFRVSLSSKMVLAVGSCQERIREAFKKEPIFLAVFLT